MSEFSYLLSQHIHNKNIKTYSLAQYCGLDRSNMYKIINGKRKPTSFEMVTNICKFMQLSPSETTEMQEAYIITLVGSENYYRRKNTKAFFEEFRLPAFPFSAAVCKAETLRKTDDTILLNTQIEINNALFQILSLEFSKKHGYIRMLIQPDYSFLMDLLVSEGIGKSDIRIDQIIHLDNANAQKNYNLNCLKKILPLYGSISKYEAFYYYDNVYGRNGDFTLFPYVLITSEYACLLTANITKGYMTCRPDSLEMFRNIFDDYLKKSSLLLKRIDNLYMQLDYVEGLFPTSLPAYSFQMTPCLTVFMTGQLTEKYVLPDMPHRSSFIEKFTNYVNNINKYRTNDSMISIFSMAGLLRFMDTGEIREYPPDTYKRPDLSDRIYFVRQILRMCQKHNYKMLKENIGDLDNEIFMYISRTRGYLMLSSPITHSLIYLDIEEPGLLFTFFDFCDNMDEQLFFSKEEMIEQLQMIIEKYQHKLSLS